MKSEPTSPAPSTDGAWDPNAQTFPHRHDEAGWFEQMLPRGNFNVVRDDDRNGLNADLLNFRPPADLQAELLRQQGIKVQRIEDGVGPVSLDYYAVHVERLPVIDGRQVTPAELLQTLRTKMPEHVHPDVAELEPASAQDAAKWHSSNPRGAVMRFNGSPQSLFGTGLDDCSVVVSSAAKDQYTFTTVFTPEDLGHVVSGTRRWGYQEQSDGSHVFYIRGVDRLASPVDAVGDRLLARREPGDPPPGGLMDFLIDRLAPKHGPSMFFPDADKNWSTMQGFWVEYINQNGGDAVALPPISERHDWDAVSDEHFHLPPESGASAPAKERDAPAAATFDSGSAGRPTAPGNDFLTSDTTRSPDNQIAGRAGSPSGTEPVLDNPAAGRAHFGDARVRPEQSQSSDARDQALAPGVVLDDPAYCEPDAPESASGTPASLATEGPDAQHTTAGRGNSSEPQWKQDGRPIWSSDPALVQDSWSNTAPMCEPEHDGGGMSSSPEYPQGAQPSAPDQSDAYSAGPGDDVADPIMGAAGMSGP